MKASRPAEQRPLSQVTTADSIAKSIAVVVSLSALGYFVGWREVSAYYNALGAPWAASLLSPPALLQLSATTLLALVMSSFITLVFVLRTSGSLRWLDWTSAVALGVSALLLFASEGIILGVSAHSAFLLAMFAALSCAVAGGITLVQCYFTFLQPEQEKLSEKNLWLVYWFVIPALFWAPDRLGHARAKLDADTSASKLAQVKLGSNAKVTDGWRILHLTGDKMLLIRKDPSGKHEFKLVEAKDVEFVQSTLAQ